MEFKRSVREDRGALIDRQAFEVEMEEIRGDLRTHYQTPK